MRSPAMAVLLLTVCGCSSSNESPVEAGATDASSEITRLSHEDD